MNTNQVAFRVEAADSRRRVPPATHLLLLALCWLPSSLAAQASISADGVVESKSGGFKFPDGTVQETAAAPGSAPVEDTGQKECWNAAGDPIGCSATGQDGELQRGVDWPTPRFTDNFNGTVTDNLTGLIWLQDANCFGTQEWEDALSDANGLMDPDCGLMDGSVATDWRLPNIKELLSLVDYGEAVPALPLGHPFTRVQSSFYWTSSSEVSDPSFAWEVDVSNGNVDTLFKVFGDHVWPVRGGQ